MTGSNLQYINNTGHQLAINPHSNHLLLDNTHFSEKLKKFKDYVFQSQRCAWESEIWSIVLKSRSTNQKNLINQWLLSSTNFWWILFLWQEIIKNLLAALEIYGVNSENNQEFAEKPKLQITLHLIMINSWKSWKIENINWRDWFGNWKIATMDPRLDYSVLNSSTTGSVIDERKQQLSAEINWIPAINMNWKRMITFKFGDFQFFPLKIQVKGLMEAMEKTNFDKILI